jgi:hypothetical protein
VEARHIEMVTQCKYQGCAADARIQNRKFKICLMGEVAATFSHYHQFSLGIG